MEKHFEQPKTIRKISAGSAYWNQRRAIAGQMKRLRQLFSAVNSPENLSLFQWAQFMAMTLEFKPDLIIELGRGQGNSTCVFTEAMYQLGAEKGFVVSICVSDDWDRYTKDRISKIVPSDWFEPLAVLRQNILTFDYKPIIEHSSRCLLLWDAHGFEIAECVLGKILPLMAGKEHLVIMHDLSDARYYADEQRYYGQNGLWRGNNWQGPRVRLGHIDSAVEQAVAIVDFVSRNHIGLYSADESIDIEIGRHPERTREMSEILGCDLFSLSAFWFYMSLNERSGVFTFPRIAGGEAQQPSSMGSGAGRLQPTKG